MRTSAEALRRARADELQLELTVRVYLPATFAVAWSPCSTRVPLPADLAVAVTDELRAALPDADEEELELEAMLEAAEQSLALVAADPSVVRRRVVLAADVPRARPAPELGSAVVRLDGAGHRLRSRVRPRRRGGRRGPGRCR